MQQKASEYITLAAASTDYLNLPLAEVEALSESDHLARFVDDDGALYVSRVSVIHYAAQTFRNQLDKEAAR